MVSVFAERDSFYFIYEKENYSTILRKSLVCVLRANLSFFIISFSALEKRFQFLLVCGALSNRRRLVVERRLIMKMRNTR